MEKMELTNPPYDDQYLLRFLRARKFDLKKTEKMWRDFIAWRIHNNVDNISVVSSQLNKSEIRVFGVDGGEEIVSSWLLPNR